ncbi:hypothetical protein NIE88_04775 [Sporolactobacillus shoreicorticis]|uniref:Uncharacterized protein n=1 Tax=Sporolactobacillus shoreicorticis TaxID=1923877 RepID=A0ABW5RYU6_9BACL|nr:hypothetical protein [Sporolactobacillus shoreicorticis]MCO7125087.1 hypothetical protein [Sporolactobacillus shoreicorticis]
MRKIEQAELLWTDLEEAIDDYLAKLGYASDGDMLSYNDADDPVVFDRIIVPVRKRRSAALAETTDPKTH